MRKSGKLFPAMVLLAVASLIFPALMYGETYELGATASGTLNGTPFTDALIVFTATGGTVQNPLPGIQEVIPTSTTFTIEGFGTGTITDSAYVFVASSDWVPVATAGIGDVEDFLDISDPVFDSYVMGRQIDPVFESAPYQGFTQLEINTSLGGLDLTGETNGYFTAFGDDDGGGDDNVVPEPSSLLLLATGIVTLAGTIRRKLA